MSTTPSHLPTVDEIASAKAYSRELAKYADKDRVRMKLSADGLCSNDIVLPGSLVDLMLRVATEVSRGNGVSILPIHSELTTQDAANILNVSRPFLVGLLDDGSIPHHKTGTHRRVLAKDVLEFKERKRLAREEALDKLAELSDEIGLSDVGP